jgi:hypothetical protein
LIASVTVLRSKVNVAEQQVKRSAYRGWQQVG